MPCFSRKDAGLYDESLNGDLYKVSSSEKSEKNEIMGMMTNNLWESSEMYAKYNVSFGDMLIQ